MNLTLFLQVEHTHELQHVRVAEARLARALKQLLLGQRRQATTPTASKNGVLGKSGSLKPAI